MFSLISGRVIMDIKMAKIDTVDYLSGEGVKGARVEKLVICH